MATVEVSHLRSLVTARLNQRYPPEHSELMAEVVMFGELAGRPSHGILRVLPGSFGAMDEEPGGEPVVERTAPAAARVIGRPGMLVVAMATNLAIEIVSEHGFAVVTTRGSRSTSGSLSYYVERMANAGLVSCVSGNTLAIVSVPGGRERMFGTNPLSFGLPSNDLPFVLDMATSAITFGEVITAISEGERLPKGVAVDSEGSATSQPEGIREGGALLPFGGHKGLGLSMLVEVLNRSLTGVGIDGDGMLTDWGHVIVAFSVGMLGDPEEIRERAGAEFDRILATDTIGDSEMRIPGHRTLRTRDETVARGTVEVDDDNYAKLIELVESGSD